MPDIHFASFVKTLPEVFFALVAANSLRVLNIADSKTVVLMPRETLERFNYKYPEIDIEKAFRKSGAKMHLGFEKGYNPNRGFKAPLGNLCRKIGEAPFCYFAPETVFLNDGFLSQLQGGTRFFKEADAFWPQTELYGPTLDEIWQSIVVFAGGDFESWVDVSFPLNYWRRYPAASPRLFYSANALEFAQNFDAFSEKFDGARPDALRGLSEQFNEAKIAAFAVDQGVEAKEMGWDKTVQTYIDFYDLILRLHGEEWQKFYDNVINTQELRPTLKAVPELEILFFRQKLLRVREGFDEAEQGFGILRMQELIERRGLRRNLRKKLRQAAQDTNKSSSE